MKFYGLLFKIVFGTVAVALILGAGAWGATRFLMAPPITSETVISNTSQILSVSREEQIVLVSLQMQGLERRDSSGKVFDWNIPGSSRTKFIQFTFNAKLGIEGKDVEITEIGEDRFLISFPEFIFIGHDEIVFAEAVESNGVLSWAAPEHKDLEMANHILSSEKKQEYVTSQKELLEEQAKYFYRDIIHAISPSVELEFEFRK